MEFLPGRLKDLWEALKPEAHSVWVFEWELHVVAWVDRHRHPWLDTLLVPTSLVTEWGLLWFGILLILFLTGDARRKRLAVQTALTIILVSAVVLLPLMHLLPRERPYEVLPGVPMLSLPLTSPSFPSGHATDAALMAVILGNLHPRQAPGLVLFALLVSYARIYCGMHWPLDVLAGLAIGAGTGMLLMHLRSRLAREASPGNRSIRTSGQ